MTEQIAPAILRALALHRLMTTAQLHAAAAPGRSRQRLGQVLKPLKARKLVEMVRAPSDRCAAATNQWFLTGAGRAEAKRLPELRDTDIAVMTQVSATVQTANHLLAVNDLGIALTRSGRACGDTIEWTHEVHHSTSTSKARVGGLTADALLCIELAETPGEPHKVLVEMDRGTQPLYALIEKVAAYMRYRNHRAPGAEHPTWHNLYAPDPRKEAGGFPPVLFVFAGPDDEKAAARQTAFAAMLQTSHDEAVLAARDPDTGLWVMTTTLRAVLGDAYGVEYLTPLAQARTTLFGTTAARRAKMTAHAG